MHWLAHVAIGITLVVAGPLHAQTRGNKMPRVGIFITSPLEGATAHAVKVFEQVLRERGQIDGKNIILVTEPAAEHLRLSELMQEHADKLLKRNPDIIWLVNTENAYAMYKAQEAANSRIPVVGASVSEAVIGLGLANSVARPGKNFTGILNMGEAQGAKRLQAIHELIPTLKRIGVLLYTPGGANPVPEATSRREFEIIAQAAKQRGITAVAVEVKAPEGLQNAFAQLAKSAVQAVMTTHLPFFQNESRRLVELATQQRLPLIGTRPLFSAQGAVLSWGGNLDVQIWESAGLVSDILKGARPGDLPLREFTKWEVTINDAAAAAFGLSVPRTLELQRTDQR